MPQVAWPRRPRCPGAPAHLFIRPPTLRLERTLSSPQLIDAVTVERRIDRHDCQFVGQCLGDEHSVEWVPVGTGQSASALSLGDANRQLLETLAGDDASNIKCRGICLRQFAEPELCGDFPSGRRADHDVVRLVRDHAVRYSRQALGVCNPPKKRWVSSSVRTATYLPMPSVPPPTRNSLE